MLKVARGQPEVAPLEQRSPISAVNSGHAQDGTDDLHSLVRAARSGDKQAQLELGIRYEEGLGVAIDRRKARKYYRMAAADAGGVLHVYTPPVGRHGAGRVIVVDRGPRQEGLAEAKARLARLR